LLLASDFGLFSLVGLGILLLVSKPPFGGADSVVRVNVMAGVPHKPFVEEQIKAEARYDGFDVFESLSRGGRSG